MKSFRSVYNSTPLHQGSGPLLALKLTALALQQSGQKKDMPLLIVSGPASAVAGSIKNIESMVSEKPASALRSVSLFKQAVAFSDELSTIASLPSLILAARNNENLLFISYTTNDQTLVKNIPASYIATACTAYPEDYIEKIRKVLLLKGVRFIEILCPDPKSGFDPSNAVEIGRLAVESCTWPLFEYDGVMNITKKLVRPEPVERYARAQSRYSSMTDQEIKDWQDSASKRWKSILEGRLY